MGACELFLEPHEVSLRRQFTLDNDESRVVVGALLERQLSSLEPSRHKPAVKKTIVTLLDDALDVYPSDMLPIRRAGIWLKWLEASYFGGIEVNDMTKDIKTLGEEIQELLSREVGSISWSVHYSRLNCL